MSNTTHCHACGQPLPPEVRRDPPLPPLDHPNILTIHDLPEGVEAKVEVEEHNSKGWRVGIRRLVPSCDSGSEPEAGDAFAAPCGASQSGAAETAHRPETIATTPRERRA